MIGHKRGTKVSKWRQKAVYYVLAPFFRLLMFVVGVTWLDKEQKRDINYQKYLGPEWKPTFSGHGI
jgi:hypothetical protein